ncbi:hypothetical protein BU14_0082s0052 [Porphyra umbilicalis]|uniref:AD domain-containing protein n=1 Tax=Porphyra umbilicalis TaxID=2786 RepID=A0A1X6PEK0_PORUM|nr:hypothetical protein BU14_0082s0052 [Porphyra umbilicalis]|eukprot:OSX79287.1 hypothetical protein BU14_0082s0052 [Porphyra umbilicalis]
MAASAHPPPPPGYRLGAGVRVTLGGGGGGGGGLPSTVEGAVAAPPAAAAAAAVASAGGVPAATREKLAAAARRVGEVVGRERARVGVGVGADGQAVFDALAKTLPVSWQGTTITILDTLHLPPPYTPAALRPVSAGGAVDELARVRMVLTNERAKLDLPAAPAAAPSVATVAAPLAVTPVTGAGPTAAVAPAVRGAWRSRGQPRV